MMNIRQMMMPALVMFSSGFLSAQLPQTKQVDEPVLEASAEDLFVALRPVVSKASQSMVEVRVWRHRVAYGTVVGQNRILTKWSEVQRDVRSLSCRTGDGRWLPATVAGIYREADLVVLDVPNLGMAPVTFAGEDSLGLGSFLVLPRPDGEAAGMGVLSVQPRSLREKDRGFLGISMDLAYQGEGVKVVGVGSGSAADLAGVLEGDLILKIDGREVSGSFELRSALQRVRPGDEVIVTLRRRNEVLDKVAQLGVRKSNVRKISEGRMDHMNRLGGHVYNEVNDGFSNVIQSDMQIQAEDCGAPVVTLDGDVIGVMAARAGRIKSYIIPSSRISELLGTEPSALTSHDMAKRESFETRRLREILRENGVRDTPESLRRHIEELRRVMEEFEDLGP